LDDHRPHRRSGCETHVPPQILQVDNVAPLDGKELVHLVSKEMATFAAVGWVGRPLGLVDSSSAALPPRR